jgi:hypothetical protein
VKEQRRKKTRENDRAARALRNVDVTLTDLPPDDHRPLSDRIPFAVNVTDATRLALREKAHGRSRRIKTPLPEMPGIHALSMTVRYMPGGREQFLEFVKLAALNRDEHAMAFWAVYADLLPTQRTVCNFDDVCFAAGVKPADLMRGVVGHGMEASVDMGNLVAAALQPDVIAAMGKSALRIDGDHAEIAARDRTQFLQGRGFLPLPKGASTHVHVNANATAAAASAAEPSVPRFADDLASLKGEFPITIDQRALPEPD